LLGKLINSNINLYKDSTTLHKTDIAVFPSMLHQVHR